MNTTTLPPITPAVAERFRSKITVNAAGCWIWGGAVNDRGYGYLSIGPRGASRMVRAHRIAWVLSGRELVAGLVLDHLCRVRLCVRPHHLELVTQQVNVLRMIAAGSGVPDYLNAYERSELERWTAEDAATELEQLVADAGVAV